MLNEIKYLTINLISLKFRLERSWGFKGAEPHYSLKFRLERSWGFKGAEPHYSLKFRLERSWGFKGAPPHYPLPKTVGGVVGEPRFPTYLDV